MLKKGNYLLLIAAGLICSLLFPPLPAAAEDIAGGAAVENGSAQFSIVESKYKRTDVSLVKVTGFSNRAAQKNINKTLRQKVADFAKEYQEPYFTSAITSKVVYNKNNLLSVVFWEYYYSQGAAHPMSFQKSSTFDLATGEEYVLSQLFARYSGYKEILNEIVSKAIEQRAIPLLEPFESIDDEQEFYIKEGALVIYYQRYKYTPYAYGFLEIEIPYGDIKDILDEKFNYLAGIMVPRN